MNARACDDKTLGKQHNFVSGRCVAPAAALLSARLSMCEVLGMQMSTNTHMRAHALARLPFPAYMYVHFTAKFKIASIRGHWLVIVAATQLY
jgi:hypothetical protein